jgi:hypothetical protein
MTCCTDSRRTIQFSAAIIATMKHLLISYNRHERAQADWIGPHRRAGWLTLLVLIGMLVEPVSAARAQAPRGVVTVTRTPSPAVLSELEQATRPYETLNGLARRSLRTELAARDLMSTVSDASRRAQQYEIEADQAVQQALDYFGGPVRPQARNAWEERVAERDIRLEAHLKALAALALTLPGSPAQKSALLQANAAAEARAAAQRQLELAIANRKRSADKGLAALRLAEERLKSLVSMENWTGQSLDLAAKQWTRLDADWRELQRTAQSAQAAGWMPAVAGAIANGWPLTSKPPWKGAASLTPESESIYKEAYFSKLAREVEIGDTDRDTLNDRLVQLRDASAWVAMSMININDPSMPGTCGETGCEHWREEALALTGRMTDLQSALAKNRLKRAESVAAFGVLPTELTLALEDAMQRHQILAPEVTQALVEGLSALQVAADQIMVWHSTVDKATHSAKSAWIRAYAQAYGEQEAHLKYYKSKSAEMEPTGAGSCLADCGGRSVPVRAEKNHALLDNALFRMPTTHTEPPGFGAYTYVIATTGGDKNNSGVYRRLRQLTQALGSLADTSTVTNPAVRQAVNLFVMPVGGDRTDPDDTSYDFDMAKQLMVQLPPGWRVATELKQAMSKGRGPFLLTLPGRLADAKGDWPVLFADLSNAPEITVANVVESYMGDLLESFWSTQMTHWKPRTLQPVALTLVRMVQSTGEVVQSVFPAATAPLR